LKPKGENRTVKLITGSTEELYNATHEAHIAQKEHKANLGRFIKTVEICKHIYPGTGSLVS